MLQQLQHILKYHHTSPLLRGANPLIIPACFSHTHVHGYVNYASREFASSAAAFPVVLVVFLKGCFCVARDPSLECSHPNLPCFVRFTDVVRPLQGLSGALFCC